MKRGLYEQGFDELDRAILEELQVNGRISNADLARKVHLSQPAIHNRLKKLEKRGIIQEVVAVLNRQSIGYDLLGFIHVSLENHLPDKVHAFQQAICEMSEVLECHHLTGDYDVLLKVVALDQQDFEHLVYQKIMTLPGVQRIQTNMVVREVKNTSTLSLK